MRTFIALQLPRRLIRAVSERLYSLQETYPAFRWTREENLHITLAFLGELDKSGIAILNEAAGLTAQNAQPITISIGNLFTLPHGRPARVLALGIGRGTNAVAALAADFENNLAVLGNQKGCPFRAREKRDFVPHITLARPGNGPLKLAPEEQDITSETQGTINALTVFKSELYRGGPIYTPISLFPLFNSASAPAHPRMPEV